MPREWLISLGDCSPTAALSPPDDTQIANGWISNEAAHMS